MTRSSSLSVKHLPLKLPATDWKLSKPFVTPANPKAGEPVCFGATLRALSSNKLFPQTVMIEVLGNQIMGTVKLTYAGPIGSDMKFKTPKTWKLQAGDYTVWLGADPPLPYQYNDPDRTNNQVSKSFTVSPLSTDWELSNPFTVPANPKAGDSVAFGATLRALSTDGPFPQTVQIEVLGSGIVDSFSVAYPGPVGSSMTIMSTKTWNLQASNYKIYLVADSHPPYHYDDSNRTNNQATTSISVT